MNHKVETLRKKQLKLIDVIQGNEEQYQHLVRGEQRKHIREPLGALISHALSWTLMPYGGPLAKGLQKSCASLQFSVEFHLTRLLPPHLPLFPPSFFSLSFPPCQPRLALSKVKEASLRRAPTQNGSARRAYLDTVHKEHGFQMAQRPPDRQIFSRLYSKVDDFQWQLDELKEWYVRNANEKDSPDMPLQSYGFKAVWMPGNGPSTEMTKTLNSTMATQKASYLVPLPPPAPRESISSMQRRTVAKMPPKLDAGIHWSNDIANVEFQTRQREQHPMYGRLDIAEPPFRPLAPQQQQAAH